MPLLGVPADDALELTPPMMDKLLPRTFSLTGCGLAKANAGGVAG